MDSRGLLLNVLNIEVSLAIRECQPVDPELVPWFASLPYSMPLNPAIKLSCIGISVANIQYRFELILKEHLNCPIGECSHSADIAQLYKEIIEFEIASSEWAQSIPKYWKPHIWEPKAKYSGAPIPMYQETCEIYPSVQIASVSNTWRGYQLIICKILAIMHTHAWVEPHTSAQIRFSPEKVIQSLVDSMCYSIPFYLGNRQGIHYISDLTNPKPHHFYPAYHNMRDPPIAKEHILHEDVHMKHVVAYGAWHSMYPLTMLVTIFTNHSGDCDCIARIPRPGQVAWIGSQLLRTMKLFGLDRNLGGASAGDPEEYARSVRRALRFVYKECISQLLGFPDDGASFVIPIVDPVKYQDRFPDFDYKPGSRR
ncbi:hypothetical protein N0V90_003575 [Kalmusia sp. IMI 367209]|nr:hypothetical protein N0V90_003575 [Kalmusia sp. IMI 367209]